MSSFIEYWKERSCYCDEAQKDAICGSCYYNNKKIPTRFIHIAKLKNGQPLLKDLLGSRKAAKGTSAFIGKDVYLTGEEMARHTDSIITREQEQYRRRYENL